MCLTRFWPGGGRDFGLDFIIVKWEVWGTQARRARRPLPVLCAVQ
jgi:hypothetical protein